MECEIVVRPAMARDMEARAELARRGVTEHDLGAFLFFFLQELTLQVCVLGGAVLFIFFGWGVWACALVLPAAAAVLAVAVLLSHRALADTHVQRMRQEVFGFVAEYRGPPLSDPRRVRARVLAAPDGRAAAAPLARLVGTASVSECWGPRRAGWLHALAVAPAWRRRGVGGALVAACQAAAAREGFASLDAVTSHVQHGARALLHAAGWEVRGSYSRPVLGAALTLPMTQLSRAT